MDRFIVLNLDEQNWLNCSLKSNMDRFIVQTLIKNVFEFLV